MLAPLMRKLIIGLIFLILAAGVLIIYLRSKNITRRELREKLKRFQIFNAAVLVIAILVGSLFAVFNHIVAKDKATAIISLNYSEASLGQNANGTRYNMSEILCDEVLEMAIEKGALKGVTVADLRKCLSVSPLVEGDATNPNKYLISTEYRISYEANKETSHLNAQNVVMLVTLAYKEMYIEKYTERFYFKDIAHTTDFSEMEYMDIVLYLNKEVNRILNYMYGLNGENASFVASNGSTFSSVAAKVYQLQKTQIQENLRSYILQNGIARDASGYIARLNYENEQSSFDKQKSSASFDICNEAVAMYSPEMTRVVLVPTWDNEGKYYMSRTKVGIDDLSVQATLLSNAITGYQTAMENNELIITKMTGARSTPTNTYVDTLIASISENIDKYAQEASVVAREYSAYRLNQCISISIYGNSLIQELKQILVITAAAYVAILVFAFARKMPKRK